MNHHLVAVVCVTACCGNLLAQGKSEQPLPAVPNTFILDWKAVARDAHQTRWASVHYATNVDGSVHVTTNSVTELAAGLNRRDASGAYVPADESFRITERGAEAKSCAHSVLLLPDINTDGAVTVTYGGVTLRNHPVGVGYFDPHTGRSIILAQVTNAVGWQTAPNEIIYSNAFDGLRSSVRYKNLRGGFEADLLLHEQPPPPERFGLSKDSRLELWTEFIGDAVVTESEERVVRKEKVQARRESMAEPDFVDRTLHFNELVMGPGKAFLQTGGSRGSKSLGALSVAKEYVQIDGRKVLIEAVEHRRIQSLLTNLPAAKVRGDGEVGQLPSGASPNPRLVGRQLPPSRFAAAIRQNSKIHTASGVTNESGIPLNQDTALVLDYFINLGASYTDFRFYGTNTYYVSGPVFLSGNTVFEPGAVIKYGPSASGASLQISGPVHCAGDNLRPIIFTGRDDNLVGAIAPSSTGTPVTGGYANPALKFTGPAVELKNCRISYSASAIEFMNPGKENRLRHCQIMNSHGVVYNSFNNLVVQNVLIQLGDELFIGEGFNVRAEHLTAHNALNLGWDFEETGRLDFTNSLAVAVVDCWMPYSLAYSSWWTDEQSIFQPVGNGGHYLPTSSIHRNAGTSGIDPTLKEELRFRTTTAPQDIGGTLANHVVLGPRGLGDTDSLDKGYHYSIADYAVNTRAIDKTVTLTNGVVVASYGTYAFWLDGAKLVSVGSPQNRNWILPYTAVQERYGTTTWGTPATTTDILINTHTAYNPGQVSPTVQMRFTNLEMPQGSQRHFYSSANWRIGHWSLQDSEVRGGSIYSSSTADCSVAFTNNLFQSVSFQVNGNASTYFFNNLFHMCSMNFMKIGSSSWVFRDNVFDKCTLSNTSPSPITHSHNAYVRMSNQLLPANVDQVITADIVYKQDALGRFYVSDEPPGNAVFDNGSRTASTASLAQYTTRLGEAKETAKVDIGFHSVAGVRQNLALNKTATQSSTFSPGVAARAVDGNTSGIWLNGSVSHTYADSQAWWEVNLDSVQSIGAIRLWNRTDCCSSRFNSAYLLVSDVPFVSTSLAVARAQAGVSSYYIPLLGESLEVPVGRTGRYVRLQFSIAEFLHLAEVEVFSPWRPSDEDSDGLADYIEDANGNGTSEVAESPLNVADVDSDGLNDLVETTLGLDPRTAQSANTTLRWNYGYDLLNRVTTVTGKQQATHVYDKEGNITIASP